MHTRARSRILTAVTAGLVLAGAGIAVADDISNSVDSTLDSTVEVMSLNVGGANGTTTLYVSPTNGDGKNGCNLTANTTFTMTLASSNAAVATVSPSSFTFGSCGDVKTVTVTPVSQGTATISATAGANTTGGSFNLAPVTFTVNVAAPANTAPTISVLGVTGGAAYTKGAVPSATCSVTDAEDGPSTFAAALSPITGPYATDGIGSQTASCSYTDKGGLPVSASKTYSIVDATAPSISYELTPTTPDGSNGWYRGNVSLTWTVTEADSPSSLTMTGCDDQNITADQQATTYDCEASSSGGTASKVSVTIMRDGTNPEVSPGNVNDTTWRSTPLSQTFTASDATSGLDSPASFTLEATEESADASTPTTVTGTVYDRAGNATTRTVSALIDKTAPTVSLVGGPAQNGEYYFNSVPPAPTCVATDALSGLASCEVTGGGTSLGSHTWKATATDNAGNTASTTIGYTVKAWDLKGFYSPVDMSSPATTIWNTVKGGSTVPLKFEAFADSELTSTTAVKSFKQQQVSCPGGAAISDAVEVTTTGGTSLRYDSTAGQFIQNWQTPKKPSTCYVVTMTTQDASTITANFILK